MENYKFIWPVILIIVMSYDTMIGLIKHGKETNVTFLSIILGFLHIWLLVLCGFFQHFNWPQITFIILMTLGLVTVLNSNNVLRHNFNSSLLSLGINLILYISGGAFQYLK